ncbi:MAG: CBS domain-containing protein [Verrucomicrobiia bacterium]|jgi:CBS domain-containing protein
MNGQPNSQPKPSGPTTVAQQGFEFYFFSELYKRPVCAGKVKDRIGKVTDLVFKMADPYPEAVGILLDHGWGKPNEFVTWDKVRKIEDDAIFVTPTENGQAFPPFVDQPGWILLNEHLMGQTILDIDGRRTEVVNDVHLLESKGRMVLVHVDISFNGFLRKWGLGRLTWIKDQFISWRYVQPLSVEDKGTDTVSLSITRKRIKNLPSEDLADALEELKGNEQQAVFSALDSEKAAEVLIEAEPRAQRQLIANLRKERARGILSEMSVPQLAALFAVLPHDDVTELMGLLPKEQADRLEALISQREVTARTLMSADYVAVAKESKVGEVLNNIRVSKRDAGCISYIYVVGPEKMLVGVVDLRDLVLAGDAMGLGDLMVSPVVSAQEHDLRDDIAEMFAKYHFRIIPVVDDQDHILGVINHRDVVGATPRATPGG